MYPLTGISRRICPPSSLLQPFQRSPSPDEQGSTNLFRVDSIAVPVACHLVLGTGMSHTKEISKRKGMFAFKFLFVHRSSPAASKATGIQPLSRWITAGFGAVGLSLLSACLEALADDFREEDSPLLAFLKNYWPLSAVTITQASQL